MVVVEFGEFYYRKNPKILDTRKIAVSILKFEQCGSYRCSLIWVYTVCPGLAVRKLRITILNIEIVEKFVQTCPCWFESKFPVRKGNVSCD